MGDLHFGREDDDAIESLLMEWAREAAYDLVVISGDFVQSGSSAEFAAAEGFLRKLSLPVLATIGNHDFPAWHLPLRLFRPRGRFASLLKNSGNGDPMFLSDAVRIFTLPTAHPFQARWNWAQGAVRHRDLKRTLSQIREADRSVWTLVTCHHPLIDHPGTLIPGRTWGGMKAMRSLGAAGVDLVLSGHTHEPFFMDPSTENDGAPLPGLVGTGTLSLRRRQQAEPTFFDLEIDREQIIGNRYSYTAGGFRKFEGFTIRRD